MLEPFQIIKSEWENINLGIQKAKHDYHSFVFSTISKNSPDSRTVILRDFDEHKPAIWFHSDIRSKKILHLGVISFYSVCQNETILRAYAHQSLLK